METVGGVTVVELLGDSLDATNADGISEQLTHLAARHPKLIVDLGRLVFLDSSGCGVLVTAQKRCREAGGDLRICQPTGRVKTVIDIARLGRVMGIYPSCEQAIASFNP